MFKTIRTILSIVLIFSFVVPIHPAQAERFTQQALYDRLPENSGVFRVQISWTGDYQANRLET